MAESKKSSTPSVSSDAVNISIEETDTDSYTDNMQPPSPKKVKYPQKFRDSWLKDPSFIPWLAKSEGNLYEAKCLLCNVTITAGKSHLIRHSSGKPHLGHMDVARMGAEETTSKLDYDDSGINMYLVKKAELRYVLDIVHHSRSFNSYGHYVPMIHAAHPDCNCISRKKMPSVALDITEHTDQVHDILNKFESKFDRAACIDEWYALGFLTVREDDMRERLLRLEIVQFWDEINKMCDPDGTKIFKNISNLALACLSLSHSNAEIERFFSLVSEIKTPRRNRLQPQMIAALGRIKLEFRNTCTQCSNYIISDDFIQNFNCDMYKKKSIPQEFANVIVGNECEFSSESDDCH